MKNLVFMFCVTLFSLASTGLAQEKSKQGSGIYSDGSLLSIDELDLLLSRRFPPPAAFEKIPPADRAIVKAAMQKVIDGYKQPDYGPPNMRAPLPRASAQLARFFPKYRFYYINWNETRGSAYKEDYIETETDEFPEADPYAESEKGRRTVREAYIKGSLLQDNNLRPGPSYRGNVELHLVLPPTGEPINMQLTSPQFGDLLKRAKVKIKTPEDAAAFWEAFEDLKLYRFRWQQPLKHRQISATEWHLGEYESGENRYWSTMILDSKRRVVSFRANSEKIEKPLVREEIKAIK